MNYSFNLRIMLIALGLFSVLFVLIFKAAAVRQQRVIWLEDLSRQVVSLASEDRADTVGRGRTVLREGGGEPETSPCATAPSLERDAQRADRIERARVRLERILDSLNPSGRMGRSYFVRLEREMERCWRKLSSPDPGSNREGEMICYRLVKRMVEDSGSGGVAARDVADQFMRSFTGELQEICLRQKFPASKERSAFTQWASAVMKKGGGAVSESLIRLLGIVGDRDSVKALKPYSRSREPEIRRAAVWAMGMQGSSEVIGDIEEILADRLLPLEEGGGFLVALERIDDRCASKVLAGVMRDAKPVLAYEAYLSLRKLRGQTGYALSLAEFEQGRTMLYEEHTAWQRARDAQDGMTP